MDSATNPSNNIHITTTTGGTPFAAAGIRVDIVSQQQRPRRERAMENFMALVMKFAASDPTRPLTDARKALIEKRLPELFTDLRTPNHPTYAAMIHRAIVELKEPEGSTEESISGFIRKQYADLPWAHSTLLKHHLQKLCECGEVVVTIDKCYLLADEICVLGSGPCSSHEREPMQHGRKIRGRPKCLRKDQIREETQPGDHVVMICGQNQPKVPCPEPPLCFNLDKELSELEQQQLPEASSHCCSEKSNPRCQLEEMAASNNLRISEKQLEAEQQHDSYPNGPLGFAADLLSVEQEQQPEFFNSERPLEHSTTNNACKSLTMKSTSLALPMNSEPSELCKQQLPNSGRFSRVKMVAEGEVDEFSHTTDQKFEEWRENRSQSQRLFEFERWWHSQRQSVSEQQIMETLGFGGSHVLKSVEKLPEMQQQQQQGKQSGRKKHAESRPEVIITQDVPTNSNQQIEFPDTRKLKLAVAVPSLDEKLCEEQKTPQPEVSTMTVSLDLSVSGKQPVCSLPEKPMKLDLVTVEQSTQIEYHGKRKRTSSESNTMGIHDLHTSSEQLADIPNPEQCQGLETRTREPFSWDQESQAKLLEEQSRREPLLVIAAPTLDLQKDPVQQPNVLISKRPTELNLATMEQSSQTVRMKRQVRRWSLETPASKPPTAELPNEESLSELKHIPLKESTQAMKPRSKLRGRPKRIKSQPKEIADSLLMPIAPQKSKLEQPLELPSPEREHKLQHQKTLEKPQSGQLLAQLPELQEPTATTTGHQHEEQKPPELDSHDGEKPLEQQSDVTSTVVGLWSPDHQNQHEPKKPGLQGVERPRKYQRNPQKQQEKQTKRRGQGQPSRPKPKDTGMENVSSSEKQLQEPKRRGRGRPRKVDKGE